MGDAPQPEGIATSASPANPWMQYGAKHLATCGSIGWSGRRVGTRFGHNPRQVWGMRNEPWFRFRNDETDRFCREAWRKPPPTRGTHFIVAAEVPPRAGCWTRIDDIELRRCPLAKYEADGFRNARLHQIGDTEFYQCLATEDGFTWGEVGRVLKFISGAQRSELSEAPAGAATEQNPRAANEPEAGETT